MKSILKSFLLRSTSRIPFSLSRRLFRFWLKSLGLKLTRDAVVNLLLVAEDVERAVDRAAIQYPTPGVHAKHELMRYHDFFVDRLRPGEKVLDIGCGMGAVAHSMASRAGAHVTAMDLNAKSIEQARKIYQHPSLDFVCGDATEGVPKGRYETIVISNVLEHIEQRVDFLKNVQRMVDPKRWLVRVPMIDRNWIVPFRRQLGLPFFSDRSHFTEYTRQSFEEEMSAAGMRVVHLQINWGELWVEAVPASREGSP